MVSQFATFFLSLHYRVVYVWSSGWTWVITRLTDAGRVDK